MALIYLDKFEPIDKETMLKMFEWAQLKPNEHFIDLGSGNGQFVLEAMRRGAISVGYEIDEILVDKSKKLGFNIVHKDCFEADVSQVDVIMCWFTKLPETQYLMDKLYNEMKVGARLIKAGKTEHKWKPVKIEMIHRNWINLYIK